MDDAAIEQILSLLAFAGLVAVAATWLGALAERLGVGRLGSGIAGVVDGAEIGLAWVVAATAVGGSLYFSEVAGYLPCVLCWFQRIAMYPMVILLAVGIVRRERVIAPYALFLAAAGLVVAIYHYQLEWFPDQSSICSTTASVPCHVVWFQHFGVSTIPFLAGSGFLMIGTLMTIAWRNERQAALAWSDDGDPAAGEAAAAEPEPPEGEAGGPSGLLIGAVAVVALALVGGALAFVALGDDEDAATTTQTTIVRPGDPASGRAVFASTGCGACHTFAPAGSAGEVGPVLDGTQLTAPELREVIAYGNGTMPGYDGDLTPQEIANVVAFVRSG